MVEQYVSSVATPRDVKSLDIDAIHVQKIFLIFAHGLGVAIRETGLVRASFANEAVLEFSS